MALQFMYVIIRYKPQGEYNYSLVQTFDKYISDNSLVDKDTLVNLQKDIRCIKDLEFQRTFIKELRKFWVKKWIKNLEIYKENTPLLKAINNELLNLLEKKEYNRIRDLADSVHNFPEMLIKSDEWKASDFWSVFIEPYRKSWDKNFFEEWKERFKPVS